jgi:MoxR-like ATPase
MSDPVPPRAGGAADAAPSPLLSPEAVAEAQAAALAVLAGLDKAILGQHDLTRMVVVACARGHVLLEGLPGLGKTELVKALGRLLGLHVPPHAVHARPAARRHHRRSGAARNAAANAQFVFRRGRCSRTSCSPTRSTALAEDAVGAARGDAGARVTVLGETHLLPKPFFVLATQNPIELEGTYPLPEAQLDRFLFKVEVPGVSAEVMTQILTERRRGEPPAQDAALARPSSTSCSRWSTRVPAAGGRRLRRAARRGDASRCADARPLVRSYVRYGASPRAAIAIGEAARAPVRCWPGGRTSTSPTSSASPCRRWRTGSCSTRR